MRKEYDFSNPRKNPYASMLKKPITIRLDEDSVSYLRQFPKRSAFLTKVVLISIYEIVPLPIRN